MGSIYADAGVNAATIGGIAGMQAGVAGNNYSDMKLTSKNATGDIGGIAGRNTAIGTVNYGYFNSEQEQRSGNSVVTPAKDIGTNVTMGSTGVVRNTAAMTGAELRSETFRDLLNENQCEDHELRSALRTASPLQHQAACGRQPDGGQLDPWTWRGPAEERSGARA